jgi:acyl-CoA reductase-like NAD-dependent aldehyde dehydrogenase
MQASNPSSSVAALVEKARSAQAGWAGCSFNDRARVLRALTARLRSDDGLVGLISAETGKPAFEAFGFEVAYLCEIARFMTGRKGRPAIAGSTRSSLISPHKRARVVWQPRGVVAVIGPSNFPLLNNFGDAIAPLFAGNSVILKPSPYTPRTSLRVLELWRELALPEGVFQVLEGGSEAGGALVDACDMVFFTGSVAAGQRIAARAGERLIPCVAELGGKSAMIVLADADLPGAARAAVWGAFAGAGQVCIRPERVLVDGKIADEFVRLVIVEAKKIRHGGEPEWDVGRVALASQMDRYRSQIEDAVARGARVLLGGQVRANATGLPTEFPRTSWNVRKYLWLPRLGCTGIQRIDWLGDVLVLGGAGVGGGSLVYASTFLAVLVWREAPRAVWSTVPAACLAIRDCGSSMAP